MTDLYEAHAGRQAATDEPGLVRADHPATSQEAALAITPVTGRQRIAILRMLAVAGPSTRQFLGNALPFPDDSVRPRVRELLEKELIEVVPAGPEHRGITWAGRTAQLLAITDKGRAALDYHDRKAEK